MIWKIAKPIVKFSDLKNSRLAGTTRTGTVDSLSKFCVVLSHDQFFIPPSKTGFSDDESTIYLVLVGQSLKKWDCKCLLRLPFFQILSVRLYSSRFHQVTSSHQYIALTSKANSSLWSKSYISSTIWTRRWWNFWFLIRLRASSKADWNLLKKSTGNENFHVLSFSWVIYELEY